MNIAAGCGVHAMAKVLPPIGGPGFLTVKCDAPKALPSSLKRSPRAVRQRHDESAPDSYLWKPVQTKDPNATALFVKTLSMGIASKTFEGAKPLILRCESEFFVSKSSTWCYLVGGKCVVCKGLVAGRPGVQTQASVRIARLPDGMHPFRPLMFAALARNPQITDGNSSNRYSLATLLVTPDGWITKVCGRHHEDLIDLSGVRFCNDKGIALVDQVSVHTADCPTGRLVSLQGALRQLNWRAGHWQKSLMTLPESCRPKDMLTYVVAGTSRESYHVVDLLPVNTPGCGAEMYWHDSIWLKDRVYLNGVMYEAAPSALLCTSLADSEEARVVKAQVMIRDLKRSLIKKYGNVEQGLAKAFFNGRGEEHDLSVNFTEFLGSCKKIAYLGNVTKLWSILDEDMGGTVSQSEFLEGCRHYANDMLTLPPVRDITPRGAEHTLLPLGLDVSEGAPPGSKAAIADRDLS